MVPSRPEPSRDDSAGQSPASSTRRSNGNPGRVPNPPATTPLGKAQLRPRVDRTGTLGGLLRHGRAMAASLPWCPRDPNPPATTPLGKAQLRPRVDRTGTLRGLLRHGRAMAASLPWCPRDPNPPATTPLGKAQLRPRVSVARPFICRRRTGAPGGETRRVTRILASRRDILTGWFRVSARPCVDVGTTSALLSLHASH